MSVNSAFANNNGTDTSVTVEKDIRKYAVESDGSFIATTDLVLLINEERAINAYAQYRMTYNRTLESLQVVNAFTQKPDGRQILVKPEQIKEQQARESSDSPMFQDTVVKVVIFPDVAVGDRLVIRFKTYRTTALFAQHFESLSHPTFHPTEQYTLIYDLPQSMPLYADARGFKASNPINRGGRTLYRWENIPGDKARIEHGSVAYHDYGQYLAVSTFRDFKAFAEAYDARAKSHATAAIRHLAQTITAHLDDPRAKAIALNEWVRKNIRYVAVYVGAGGVVPHPVETILANRYGDCKDHAVLLEALLAAVAIDSTAALVNSGNAYTLPKVPTLGVLDHVINYIPSLDLYLDSTAESIEGGYLPIYDLDKPVVFTKSGTLGKTPANQPGKVEITSVFRVDLQGDVDFDYSSRVMGWGAEVIRSVLHSMSSGEREVLVKHLLAANGQTGSGRFNVIQPQPNDNVFSMNMNGQSLKYVAFPGPTGISTTSSLAGGISQNVFALGAEQQRTQAFTCISGVTVETARFEFPDQVSIVALPKNMTVDHPKFEYRAEYTEEPQAVVVRRYMKFQNEHASCTPEEFTDMASVISLMVSDLKSQIIVQVQ